MPPKGIREQFHVICARRVDLILGRILEPKPDEDLDVDILFEDRLFVLLPGEDSKWHRRRRINPADLINEPWVLPAYDTFIGSIVKEAFQSIGL